MKRIARKLIVYFNDFVGLCFITVIRPLDYFFRALGGTEISHMLYSRFRTTKEIVTVGGLGSTSFYAPSKLLKWRVETWLSKEPETIDWIDSLKISKDDVFWDIGACSFTDSERG
jgi:hypothetical protein